MLHEHLDDARARSSNAGEYARLSAMSLLLGAYNLFKLKVWSFQLTSELITGGASRWTGGVRCSRYECVCGTRFGPKLCVMRASRDGVYICIMSVQICCLYKRSSLSRTLATIHTRHINIQYTISRLFGCRGTVWLSRARKPVPHRAQTNRHNMFVVVRARTRRACGGRQFMSCLLRCSHLSDADAISAEINDV